MNKPNGDTQISLKTQLIILGIFVALFWGLEILDIVLFSGRLDSYGIWPRHLIGLRGIIFAPFLHGGLAHVAANTLPFLILGWLVMVRRLRDFAVVTVLVMLIGGIGIWLFGRINSVHLGASILVFGFIGYLLLRGFFERSLPAMSLSLFVVFFYGTALWGLLPGQPGISWLGHLFGFAGGVAAAYLLAERQITEPDDDDDIHILDDPEPHIRILQED